MKGSEELLTVDEFREPLKLERYQVYQYVRDGKLRAVKFSRKTIRIPKSEQERAIRSGLNEPIEEPQPA